MEKSLDIFNLGRIITSNFDEPVLYEPARIENGYNILKIVSAFTDCERITSHVIRLSDEIKEKKCVKNISIELIVGMSKSSISLKKHRDICRMLHYMNLERSMPHFSCRYILTGQEVHTKLYIWGKDKPFQNRTEFFPYISYAGSLNYTMNAFKKRREMVCTCDSLAAYRYYKELYKDTIDCTDALALERIKNNTVDNLFVEDDSSSSDYEVYNRMTPIDTINISLLKADGSAPGYGSGINWGIRPNGTKRNPNQAYIPYNIAYRKPGFFPDRTNPSDVNCPVFRVVTKEFGTFHMRMAQQGNKALQSAESNAILGEWLRSVLGVPSGCLITIQMLKNYGKTFVTFRKYEDGTYLLDF